MLRCTANATKVEPKAEQQDMPQKEPIHDSDTGNANKPERRTTERYGTDQTNAFISPSNH